MRPNHLTVAWLCLFIATGILSYLEWFGKNALESELAALRMPSAQSKDEVDFIQASLDRVLTRTEILESRIGEAKATVASLTVNKSALEEKLALQEKRLNEIIEVVETTSTKHQAQMDALRGEYESHQETFRSALRSKAPGTGFETLTYDGKTFLNAIVLVATPATIDIRHDSGVARLDFAHLSTELREQFGYDPSEAAEHLKAKTEQKSENLVSFRSAKDIEDAYERTLALRIRYQAWLLQLSKADDDIRRKEARIQSLKDQLAQTKPGAYIINRLKTDIASFTRDLTYLRRNRRDFALTEPVNPDAE